jgi:hypothetical protein
VGERRLLVDIDDLEIIPPWKILLAKLFEVGDRSQGVGSLAGDIETQDIPGGLGAGGRVLVDLSRESGAEFVHGESGNNANRGPDYGAGADLRIR